MKVLEAMSKAVVADDDIKLKDAAKIMSDKNIGSLIILKKDKIIGIITERDILKNIDKLNNKVSDVMSKNVISINSEDSLEKAAGVMSKYKIKRLPIIKDNKLAGIITTTDIIAYIENLNEEFYFD